MHFHLPKPLHGWREFAGEVGIIVIGVLIALGAEQVLEDWHWHNEVGNFRAAVDHEIGRNLDVWRIMMSVRPCVAHRLDDLGRLLAASTGGRQLHLLGPIDRPVSYSSYYSVWDDKAEDVTGHLPLDARLKYAEIYDELHNNDVVRLDEREVWRSLDEFDQPEPLDHADRMRLRGLLTRARQLDEAERSNAAFITMLGARLGIHPISDADAPVLSTAFCKPLLATG